MSKSKTIDITVKWKAAARIYIEALESGTPEGRSNARAGIMEMAEHLDRIREGQEQEDWPTVDRAVIPDDQVS